MPAGSRNRGAKGEADCATLRETGLLIRDALSRQTEVPGGPAAARTRYIRHKKGSGFPEPLMQDLPIVTSADAYFSEVLMSLNLVFSLVTKKFRSRTFQ